MTLIVGILCADGVVVASDSMATLGALGQRTVKQNTEKIEILHNTLILACAGAVGLKQKITGVVTDATENNKLAKSKPHEVMGKLTDAVRSQVRPELEMAAIAVKTLGPQVATAGAIAQTIIAIPVGDRGCLFQFDQQASGEQATDTLPFVAIGSGSHNADVFLAFLRRTFWPDKLPPIVDAAFAAAWCLDHAIQIDPGGVGGEIFIATLSKDGGKWKARRLERDEIDDHVRAAKAAEEYLRKFKAQLGAPTETGDTAPAPEPPKPEPAV